jgi:hypothetical protein
MHFFRAWERPVDDIKNGSKPSLWGYKGVLPDGVDQSILGDCWFMAPAAALAEHPKRIKKLFRNKEYSDTGIFMVYFFIRGEWVGVNVDDVLPMGRNPG